jgi:hypothetical protein
MLTMRFGTLWTYVREPVTIMVQLLGKPVANDSL